MILFCCNGQQSSTADDICSFKAQSASGTLVRTGSEIKCKHCMLFLCFRNVYALVTLRQPYSMQVQECGRFNAERVRALFPARCLCPLLGDSGDPTYLGGTPSQPFLCLCIRKPPRLCLCRPAGPPAGAGQGRDQGGTRLAPDCRPAVPPADCGPAVGTFHTTTDCNGHFGKEGPSHASSWAHRLPLRPRCRRVGSGLGPGCLQARADFSLRAAAHTCARRTCRHH